MTSLFTALGLSPELESHIYCFDPTYHIIFNKAMNEITLRYDDGKWWLKSSKSYMKGIKFLTKEHARMSEWATWGGPLTPRRTQYR